MSNLCAKIEFVLLMIENIDKIIKRHKKITLALEDIEGQAAILMFLMQIGETLNKIYKKYPRIIIEYDLEIEVKGSYNVRNFIAHDYEGVNLSLIDSILRDNIPLLKEKLLKVCNEQ